MVASWGLALKEGGTGSYIVNEVNNVTGKGEKAVVSYYSFIAFSCS